MNSRLNLLVFLLLTASLQTALAAEGKLPIKIGLSAEFSLRNSGSAQAIEKGILLAIDEVNAAGGVLHGRPLALSVRDDRGLPARAEDNFIEFANDENIVGVFGGRFSPASLTMASIANARQVLLLVPWSAADPVTQHVSPNFVFRVSMTDSWAVHMMLEHLQKRRFSKIAFVIPNTAWGRSCEQALLAYQKQNPRLQAQLIQYNIGKSDFKREIKSATDFGAKAIILVAMETEGASLVQQLAQLPDAQRIPVISHWGVLGGDFVRLTGEALNNVDFRFVTTFSFANKRQQVQKVICGVRRLFKEDAVQMTAQPGFAHAYDLTHMLAIAINQARSAEPDKVRLALENIDTYHGLVRTYHKPFSRHNHEGLDKQQIFLDRFTPSGLTPSLKMKILNGN